jgi:organic radical activating enzyme
MSEKKGNITEVFSSIQGEGPYIGERQIFIRFHGCNLKCSFCDVDKDIAPTSAYIEDLIAKIDELNADNIHNSVALTGGEPLLHSVFLRNLLPSIIDKGLKVYLETNATLYKELETVIRFIDTISADIKLPSVTKDIPQWQNHQQFLEEASKKEVFVKVVVSDSLDMADFDKAIELVKEINYDIPFIIQPQTKNSSCELNIRSDRILELQAKALKSLNNVLVIPQAHKMLGVN